MENKIQIFEKQQVRSVWDEEQEKWWFSSVDICAILTDSDYQTARKYWKVLKGRLEAEGNELVTNCYQLKLLAADGKYYKSDVADTEQVLRLIQSIPSKKAEPFKMWLAQNAKQLGKSNDIKILFENNATIEDSYVTNNVDSDEDKEILHCVRNDSSRKGIDVQSVVKVRTNTDNKKIKLKEHE